jgi:hypothetical protein
MSTIEGLVRSSTWFSEDMDCEVIISIPILDSESLKQIEALVGKVVEIKEVKKWVSQYSIYSHVPTVRSHFKTSTSITSGVIFSSAPSLAGRIWRRRIGR